MGLPIRFVVTALVRLALLAMSIAGWVVFVVGFVQLNKRVHRYYAAKEEDFGPEYVKQFLRLVNTLFIPMWVFVASGLVTYIILGLHIIVRHETVKHILHSTLMFFNVLYMFGASGTSIIALAYSLGKPNDTIHSIAHLDQESAKIVLCGVTLAMGKYWISTFIWPLFEIKCQRTDSYYPVAPLSIQDNNSGWVPRRPPLKRYNSNSGRFSNSRELLQQVSEEEIDYEYTD